MRKVFVVMLALLLCCWGLFLLACASRSDVQVTRPAATALALKTPSSKPTPTRIPSTPIPTATPPALAGDNVQATVPVSVRDNIFFRGSSSLHEIALTFDDGPHPIYTLQVLNILQRYAVKATFFCIGRQIPAYAAIVRQVGLAGDQVADHTWDHFDLTKLSIAAIQSQLLRTAAEIGRVTDVVPHFFRPPYGAINNVVKEVSTRLGLTPVMWNVDTNDWRLPGVATIVRVALVDAGNGSVILMHDGGGNRSQTVQALPQIIIALEQRGFRFVTVQQLLYDTMRVDP